MSKTEQISVYFGSGQADTYLHKCKLGVSLTE